MINATEKQIAKEFSIPLKSLKRMQGGEIFVPKIPSVRITDLAQAMAPILPTKITGIRPGEKIHEVMCPADDAHQVFDFEDHYVITPAIIFWDNRIDYGVSASGVSSSPVPEGFEYQSGTNPTFLTMEQIRQYNLESEIP